MLGKQNSNLRISILFSIVGFMICEAGSLEAATVAWNTSTNISGDSDVLTTGSLVAAYNIGDTEVAATTVNGVTFDSFPIADGDEGNTVGDYFVGASPGFMDTATNWGSASAPFSNLSASYQPLLSTGAGTSGLIFISMGGLTPGDTYAIQIWGNDSGLANGGSAYDVDNNTSALDPNTSNETGGLGQYAIGAFVADDSNQAIQIGRANLPDDFQSPVLNAFQIRLTAVPEPDTFVLGGLGLFGLFFAARRKK